MRSDSGYFTYIITTRRMTSGELSKYRNGFVDLAIMRRYGPVFDLAISLG